MNWAELNFARPQWWFSANLFWSTLKSFSLNQIFVSPQVGLTQLELAQEEKFKTANNCEIIEQLPAKEDFISTWFKNNRRNPDAFGALYSHLKNRLFSLVYRYTYNREAAEDILQETFIQIYKKMSTVTNPETFQAWIYRVAINTALSYLRRHRRHLHLSYSGESQELDEGKLSSPRSADEAIGEDESMIHQAIDEALRKLPAGLKTVFILHDVQGFTHEEIATILDTSVGTSKSQLFKARLKIREFLRKKEITPGGRR